MSGNLYEGISTFTGAIDEIQDQIMQMGSHVKQEMLLAVEALVFSKSDNVPQVYAIDKTVDQYDKNIQSSVLQLITIQPPLAQELQALATMIRVSRELERIGDHAVNIADVCQTTSFDSIQSQALQLIHGMSGKTIEMLDECMQAFKEKDLDQALQVAEKDQTINQNYEAVQRQLIVEMKANTEGIEALSQLFIVNRYLERASDHLVNISRKVKDSIY